MVVGLLFGGGGGGGNGGSGVEEIIEGKRIERGEPGFASVSKG